MTKISSKQFIGEIRNKKLDKIIDKDKYLNEKTFSIFNSYKRNEFENLILKKGTNSKYIWLDYIKWEENNGNIQKCRDLWERACNIFINHSNFWLKYIAMELRNNEIDRARVIFERSIKYNPYANILWEKYIDLEMIFTNNKKIRNIYRRWISFDDTITTWIKYLKFEISLNNKENANNIVFHLLDKKFSHNIQNHQHSFLIDNLCEKSLRIYYTNLLKRSQDILDKIIVWIKIANCENLNTNYRRGKIILDLINTQINFRIKKRLIPLKQKIFTKFFVYSSSKFLFLKRNEYNDLINSNLYNFYYWQSYANLEYNYGSIETTISVYERSLTYYPLRRHYKDVEKYITLWENMMIILNLQKFYNSLIKYIEKKLINLTQRFEIFQKKILFFFGRMFNYHNYRNLFNYQNINKVKMLLENIIFKKKKLTLTAKNRFFRIINYLFSLNHFSLEILYIKLKSCSIFDIKHKRILKGFNFINKKLFFSDISLISYIENIYLNHYESLFRLINYNKIINPNVRVDNIILLHYLQSTMLYNKLMLLSNFSLLIK
uniref:Cell division control protein n=1 Tax=Amorphochlora amoebiformis TaxID=1561963 RepID=A0A0H5BLJ6_9EUKA|nr:cell division control protein [Amorphochlora amoebiformis]